MLRRWLLACLLLLGLPWYSASAAASTHLPAAMVQPMAPSQPHANSPHEAMPHEMATVSPSSTDCHGQPAGHPDHCQGQMPLNEQCGGKVHCSGCLTPVAALPDLTTLGPKLSRPGSDPLLLGLAHYLDHIPGVPSPPPTPSFI